MAKPTKYPTWDTNETNTSEPETDRQLSGWAINSGIPEKPLVQWINYLYNLIYKWIVYFDESINPGLDKSATHNMTSDTGYILSDTENIVTRLEITDTNPFLTGPVNITTDDIEHTFLFINSTLQDLTVKTSAGTGVTVIAGTSKELRNNTINIEEYELEAINAQKEAQTKIGDLTIGETVLISSWSYSGTTITINTSSIHNLSVGQYFNVSGLV
ncbi:MAG: hypothetical protein U9Q29_02750, partial [Campylobacterota bacterium]|nr:hypothetical protein [Campylobacterota bacterium]